jgi:hypothetical protein
MNFEAQAPLLIHTRRGAVGALCVWALFTLRNLRYLFEFYVPGHIWLTRYNFPPTRFDRILDICCTLLFSGALVYLLRRCREGERIYLALFVSAAILAPLRDLPINTSIHVYTWLETILELALIPIAIWMYRSLPAHRIQAEAK